MRHRRRGGIADATLPGAGLAEWQAPAAGFFLWVKATVTCEGMACEERLRASMAECKVVFLTGVCVENFVLNAAQRRVRRACSCRHEVVCHEGTLM